MASRSSYMKLRSSIDMEPQPRPLNATFFDRDPQVVARALIGVTIIREFDDHVIASGRIVETEAYLPVNDPAAHGARGPTTGNRALYMRAGTLYIHSMHRQFCMDIVTQDSSRPGSVLIRAIEPIEGIDIMSRNRGTDDLRKMANGPGKLCQALSITKAFDKLNVTDKLTPIRLHDNSIDIHEPQIAETSRIGLSKGTNLRLRFCLIGSRYLSRGTPTTRVA